MDLRAVQQDEGLIDAGLWERAAWFGVGFLGPREEPPCPSIGLILGNELPASAIFSALRWKLGPVDERGALRLTFVEGDLPGQAPCYTLVIASSTDPSAFRARRLAASPALSRFKADYANSGRCLLVPLVVDATYSLRGLDHVSIETNQVAFRHLSEIDDALSAAVASASATTARNSAPARSAASSRAQSARASRRPWIPGR